MDIFVIGLLLFNTLLLAALVHVHGSGFRLMSREFSSFNTYQHNLARDIGNRFSGVDSSLVTISRSSADAFGSVKDELLEFKSVMQELRQSSDSSFDKIEHRFHEVDNVLKVAIRNRFNDVDNVLNQVHGTVAAFKNDLITQVRLSREDYEELMATAESKNVELPQQLNDLRLTLGTLQTELTDFRSKFDEFTR